MKEVKWFVVGVLLITMGLLAGCSTPDSAPMTISTVLPSTAVFEPSTVTVTSTVTVQPTGEDALEAYIASKDRATSFESRFIPAFETIIAGIKTGEYGLYTQTESQLFLGTTDDVYATINASWRNANSVDYQHLATIEFGIDGENFAKISRPAINSGTWSVTFLDADGNGMTSWPNITASEKVFVATTVEENKALDAEAIAFIEQVAKKFS